MADNFDEARGRAKARPSVAWLLVPMCGIGFLLVAIGITLFTSLGS